MSNAIAKITLRFGVPAAAVVGLHYAYKRFNFNAQVYDVPRELKNRVIVITGADKGIGRAAVEALAPSGARIIMACRSSDECRDVRRQIVIASRNRQVVCRECDLSSFDSIKKFAARIIKEEPRVDILVNNAGIKYINPRRSTRESIERQLGVNFIGHYLLTSLLMDKLKEAGNSRIVNVIGKAYKKGEINFDDLNWEKAYSPAKAYDQSKLALALTTIEMARQLDATKVTVNGVDPGYTYTNIERHTDAWFRLIRNTFYYITRREARQGAFPVLYAALSLEMNGVTGKFVNSDLNVEEFDKEVAEDKILQRKVWLTAEKWSRVEKAKEDVRQLIAAMPDKPAAVATNEKQNDETTKKSKVAIPAGIVTTVSTIVPNKDTPGTMKT